MGILPLAVSVCSENKKVKTKAVDFEISDLGTMEACNIFLNNSIQHCLTQSVSVSNALDFIYSYEARLTPWPKTSRQFTNVFPWFCQCQTRATQANYEIPLVAENQRELTDWARR